jgi:acyl carrier protein
MSMVSREDGLRRIMDWVRTHSLESEWDRDALDPSTDLIASGILDSVGFLDLLSFLEELTGCEVDLSDIDPTDFTTAGGLAAFALRDSSQEGSYVGL